MNTGKPSSWTSCHGRSSTGMAAITGSGRFPAPSNTGPWPSPSCGLRDIETCLSVHASKLYHMGFRQPVRREISNIAMGLRPNVLTDSL